MKVVIIGCGAQGTGLAGLLAMEKDVEQLVLADYSEEAVQNAYGLVQTLGEKIHVKKIVRAKVNAGSIDDVARVIHGSDICFHAILPRFNMPIMKACLKEKVNYLDLIALPGSAEDGAETIGAQFALDREFAKAGLLAVPSVGISPGWTLFAAAEMVKEFDTVKEVVVRWADFVDTEEFTSSINPAFMLSEWIGAPHPCAWKNGKIIAEDLFESEEEFEFPAPIGKRKIYTCTSQPDIVMIPQLSPIPIPYCVEKGSENTANRNLMQICMAALAKAGTSTEPISEGSTLLDELGKTMIPPSEHGRLFEEGKIRDHAVCFTVEVNGYKNGKFISHTQYNNCTKKTAAKYLPWSTPAVYDTVGGLPLILILMIGRGELEKKGVFSAGQLGIADRVKKELKEREHDITERILEVR